MHSYRPILPVRFERLTNYLSSFYQPHHEVVAFYTRPHPLAKSTVVRTPLVNLSEHASALHIGFTLYVPPICDRPVHDLDLARLIDDPGHLDSITHP